MVEWCQALLLAWFYCRYLTRILCDTALVISNPVFVLSGDISLQIGCLPFELFLHVSDLSITICYFVIELIHFFSEPVYLGIEPTALCDFFPADLLYSSFVAGDWLIKSAF